MASTDARPVPIKNTAFRATFPILDADGDLVTGATALDSEVSLDAGTFADCTSEATEIATASGIYYLDLTAAEMNADTVAIIIKTTTVGAKTTLLVFYPQESGDIKVDIQSAAGTAWASGAITAASIAADAITAAKVAADVTTEIQTGLATAANLTTLTSYVDTEVAAIKAVTDLLPNAGALTSLATAASLATVATYIDTEVAAIKAVTDLLPNAGALTTIQSDLDDIQTRIPAALVGGRIDASVGAMAASSLTATAIAADAITAAKLAADVTTELQAGLATAASLATVTTYVDTEVAAIKAVTDLLPNGGALSSLATAASITTLTGYVDTEVAAIKAVTDLLPNAGALTTIQSDLDDIQTRLPAALVAGRIDASVGAMAANTMTAAAAAADLTTELQTGLATAASITGLATSASLAIVATYIDTEVASIKAVTDLLPNGGALTSLATAANLATVAGYLDTEIASILAVTNALPNAGALTTIQSDLDDLQTRLPAALIGGKIDANVASVDALGTQAKADVNAEVKDVMEVDTHAELTALPSASAPTKLNMMQLMYQFIRFLKTQSLTELKMYKANNVTVLSTQAVSDDGTTTTVGAGT